MMNANSLMDIRLLNPGQKGGPQSGRDLIRLRLQQAIQAETLARQSGGHGRRARKSPETMLRIFERQAPVEGRRVLEVDPMTLLDLEIFQTFGVQTVFDLMNFTRTTYGEVRLAELFAEPMGEREAILRRQAGVREIYDQPQVLADLQAELDRVENQYVGNLGIPLSPHSQYIENLLDRERPIFRLGKNRLSSFLVHTLGTALSATPAALSTAEALSLIYSGQADADRNYFGALMMLFMTTSFIPMGYLMRHRTRMEHLSAEQLSLQAALVTLANCARILKGAQAPELREKAELIERFASGKPIPGTPHLYQRVQRLNRYLHSWFHRIPLDHEYFDRQCRPDIVQLLSTLGDIDALCSQAQAAQQHGMCFPEIVEGDSPEFSAEGIGHPFVANVVRNDVGLGGDRRFEVISGPNMSGKSHHLKAANLIVLMAQMGGGVPARRARLTPFEVLMSNVNIVDSLSQGMSLFFSEEVRTAQMVAAARSGRRVFLTADEIFRGTNSLQGSAAGIATLEDCMRSRGTVGLLAVHEPDFTEWVEAHPELPWANFHFVVEEGAGGLVFTRRLEPGLSRQFLAFDVLAQAGYPADVIGRARAIAAEMVEKRKRQP